MQTDRQKLYDRKWRAYRLKFLRAHPYCEMHKAQGLVMLADIVDHITPHRGNIELFWDTSNHQALCKQCHDSHKKRLETSGKVIGCDTSGLPINKQHHWYK